MGNLGDKQHLSTRRVRIVALDLPRAREWGHQRTAVLDWIRALDALQGVDVWYLMSPAQWENWVALSQTEHWTPSNISFVVVDGPESEGCLSVLKAALSDSSKFTQLFYTWYTDLDWPVLSQLENEFPANTWSITVNVHGSSYLRRGDRQSYEALCTQRLLGHPRVNKLLIWDPLTGLDQVPPRLVSLPEYHGGEGVDSLEEDTQGWISRAAGKTLFLGPSYRGLGYFLFLAVLNPDLEFYAHVRSARFLGTELRRFGFAQRARWSRFARLIVELPETLIVIVISRVLKNLHLSEQVDYPGRKSIARFMREFNAVFISAKAWPNSSGVALTALSYGVPVIWRAPGRKTSATHETLMATYPVGLLEGKQRFRGLESHLTRLRVGPEPKAPTSWSAFQSTLESTLAIPK